jgi:hypothetical protein
VRQRDANIVNGGVGNASDVKAEFDQVQLAFNATTGHKHDGSTGEGVPITVTGVGQDYIFDPLFIKPKITATYDLGSSSFRFKDGHFSGTVSVAALTASGAISAASGTIGGVAITTATNTQTLTGKTIDLGSNTVTMTSAQLATALTDETGTGANVFAGSPALTGTPTAPTAAAATNTTQIATTAHVFAERSNTATLTNKTLTSPVFSDPAVARMNLGVAVEIIAQGTLSGSELIIAIPSEFEGIELSYWSYQPSTSGTALRMAFGSGTVGSPTWGALHYEQVQSVIATTYAPSVVGPLGYTNLSFDQLGAGQAPGNGRAVAIGFHVAGYVYGDTMRRGIINSNGPQRVTSHGSFSEDSLVVHTLIRIFVSAGTMSGSYRLLGYRKP